MFRFHTGSIKSDSSNQSTPANRFRFHTGSIKRADATLRSIFVSTTGSIKRIIAPLDRVELGFDSILVRLKAWLNTASVPNDRARMFRFHTGSIKSQLFTKTLGHHEKSFDSILVRLKVWILGTGFDP